jgi:LCP family protein required for cell wall assembly
MAVAAVMVEVDLRATVAVPISPIVATATPTARPVIAPTLGAYVPITSGAPTAIPTAVMAAALPEAVFNVLLIGGDGREGDARYRTDSLIVVSVDRNAGTVTLISIPRDLFVYVPRYGMERINVAYEAGERLDGPGGGQALLDQTLLYNLGLPIHFHAQVDFSGFKTLVDALGGIEVPVVCPVIDLELADQVPPERAGLERQTIEQPIGLTTMDGARALWYARVRPAGGDYFRSYRQRQVLRAIYQAVRSTEMLNRVPELYAAYGEIVQTDLGLWDLMPFVPLATELDETRVRAVAIGPNQTTPWTTPAGEQVLLPRPGAIEQFLDEALNSATAAPQPAVTATPVAALADAVIDIVDASGMPDYGLLASEVLRNEGFTPGVPSIAGAVGGQTQLMRSGPAGSDEARLLRLVHLPAVSVLDSSAATTHYTLELGADYIPCPRLDWLP